MTIVESIKCVLQQNNDGLTSKQIYDEIIRQGLYSFGAENPVGVVNAQLRRRCIGLDFPTAYPIKFFEIAGYEGKKIKFRLISTENTATIITAPKTTDISELLPEEKIKAALQEHLQNIRQQVFDSVLNNSPEFFEHLVVDLLLKMGYGYVAIRQNEKFKEENDKTQERLEKIALNANELSVIGKVIEYESTNIAKLTEKVEKYYTACSADGLIEYLKLNNITQDENGFCLAKERKKSELEQLFSDLFDEVKLDFHNFNRLDKTSDVIFDIKVKTMDLLEKMYEVYLHNSTGNIEPDVIAFIESRQAFRNEMDILITRKRLYLDSIIYGQISYDKIKKDHYGKQKESQENGQDEI